MLSKDLFNLGNRACPNCTNPASDSDMTLGSWRCRSCGAQLRLNRLWSIANLALVIFLAFWLGHGLRHGRLDAAQVFSMLIAIGGGIFLGATQAFDSVIRGRPLAKGCVTSVDQLKD